VAYPHPMLPRGAAALRRMKATSQAECAVTHSWHGAPGHKGRRHKKFTGHRAMCGRLRVGKGFLYACSSGRSSHMFGLLARFT
jgi:hypothetical protein